MFNFVIINNHPNAIDINKVNVFLFQKPLTRSEVSKTSICRRRRRPRPSTKTLLTKTTKIWLMLSSCLKIFSEKWKIIFETLFAKVCIVRSVYPKHILNIFLESVFIGSAKPTFHKVIVSIGEIVSMSTRVTSKK